MSWSMRPSPSPPTSPSRDPSRRACLSRPPEPNPTGVKMGGYQQLVRGELMRGRFRHSYEKPEAFTPGKMDKVEYTMPDVCHIFRRGHRIMVQVESSWFPLA